MGDKIDAAEASALYQMFAGSDGTLTAASLAEVMRVHLGMDPKACTPEIAKEILEEVAPSGSMDVESFTKVIGGKREFPDTKDDVVSAFKTMGDHAGTGKIELAKMRSILTTFGAKLTQEEMEDLVKKAGVDAAGRIEYAKWVDLVYSS